METIRVADVPAPTRYSLVIGFTGAVVIASLLHAPAAPLAARGPFGLVGVDKWIHVGSYAGVAFLLAYAHLARTLSGLVAIACASVLIGAGVELLQSMVPWRTMEFADVLANAAGTILALCVWRYGWEHAPVADHPESTG